MAKKKKSSASSDSKSAKSTNGDVLLDLDAVDTAETAAPETTESTVEAQPNTENDAVNASGATDSEPLAGSMLFKTVTEEAPAVTVKEITLPPIVPVTEPEGTPGLLDDKTREHLHLFDIHTELSVPDFRHYSSTGRYAGDTLLHYESRGLLVKSWKSGKSVYRLSATGRLALT